MLGHKSRQQSLYPHSRRHLTGTLPDQEPDELPVTEAGLSVEPENLGRQFLRDATEQDNYESSVSTDWVDPLAVGLGQVVSQGTLESAGQEDIDIPASEALGTAAPEENEVEPTSDEVDLLSNTIHDGSLFDEPTERGGIRVPKVHADELEVLRGAPREQAKQEGLQALLRFRKRLKTPTRRR